MELKEGQLEALNKIEDWMKKDKNNRPFNLQGYAGTGKSTLVHHILNNFSLDNIALAAPTGKAARVLSEKTNKHVSTIHSLLYKPLGDQLSELQETLAQLHEDYEKNPESETLEHMIEKTEEEIQQVAKEDPQFIFKGGEGIEYLLTDEAYMVRDDIIEDILGLGVPTMFVGDPGQLPPVKGRSGLLDFPADIVLEEIVRTEGVGAGINFAAQDIRLDRPMKNYEGFTIHPPRTLNWDHYVEADMVLCGTNKLRRRLNKGIRKRLGLEDPYPVEGEPVICLGNNKFQDVVNGEILTVKEIHPTKRRIWTGYFEDSQGKIKHLKFWAPLFEYDGNTDIVPAGIVRLTHARALTVHKAQGSEADHVIICDDWGSSYKKEWLYTGVTRGKREVDLIQVPS